jgi:mannose-6-phosphate isomerase-like protein (cupin superfamily)
VMKGSGTATVGGGRGGAESAPVKEGDAIPIQLGEAHSFENTGTEPLEFMIVGVARDLSKHVDSIDAGAGRGGRGGN